MGKLDGFTTTVGLVRTFMKINGVWPGHTSNSRWFTKYRFLLPIFLMILSVNVPQTRLVVLMWHDFDVVLEVLTTVDVVTALSCFKLLTIRYNEKAEDWKETNPTKLNIMWRNLRISRLLMIATVTSVFGTVIAYALEMIILVYITTPKMSLALNETLARPMYLPSDFPFDWQKSPYFEICWYSQMASCIVGTLSFTSFDGFFIFSILHLCGQMKNLQLDMKQVISKTQREKYRNFNKHLGLIIDRHNQLYRLMDCIEDSFNLPLLIQIFIFSILFCLQGYHVTVVIPSRGDNNIASILFILLYTVANVMSIFLYCFVVEKLRNESMELFFIIYDIEWYELCAKDSRMIINIMQKTKLPIRITAGKFFVLSLEYFMTVVKSSLGYLSMLVAVKERIQ